MARGMKSLKRSGRLVSDQIWLGIQRYRSLEAAADSISCLEGFEAVTARRLRCWIEKRPDELGKKVHRLLMLDAGAIYLGELKHLQFQIQEVLLALSEARFANLCIDRAKMRTEFALTDCKRMIQHFKYQRRKSR
jgi:hypothetical protein